MSDEQQRAATTSQLQQIVEAAFASAPILYANGFVNGLGVTDAYVVLQANGRSVAVANMPLAVAKALGEGLLEMVRSYEAETGRQVPSLDELSRRA